MHDKEKTMNSLKKRPAQSEERKQFRCFEEVVLHILTKHCGPEKAVRIVELSKHVKELYGNSKPKYSA